MHYQQFRQPSQLCLCFLVTYFWKRVDVFDLDYGGLGPALPGFLFCPSPVVFSIMKNYRGYCRATYRGCGSLKSCLMASHWVEPLEALVRAWRRETGRSWGNFPPPSALGWSSGSRWIFPVASAPTVQAVHGSSFVGSWTLLSSSSTASCLCSAP